MGLFRKFLRAIFIKPGLFVLGVKVNGLENIPKEGPAIISGNHVHSFDSVALIGIAKRNISFMGKEELNEKFLSRNLAVKPFDIILTKRGANDLGSINEVDKRLEEGKLVGIFPEGTRYGMLKGRKMKHGAIYFSIKNKVPIIPVGFSGNFKMFTKTEINIGKPIKFYEMLKDGEDETSKDALERLTLILRDEIISLTRPEIQKEYISAIEEVDKRMEAYREKKKLKESKDKVKK